MQTSHPRSEEVGRVGIAGLHLLGDELLLLLSRCPVLLVLDACSDRLLAQALVRDEILAQLHETRQHMNQLMLDAIRMAEQVESSGDQELSGYVIAGETNLMGFAELSNVEKLRRLFEAFNEKRDILHLLDQSLNSDGVQIFIGQESGYKLLDACSIVAAPYQTEENTIGVLGVIGPTRMAYDRVIPIVDVTAKLLGRALRDRA